jgi:hypothetical protein
VGGWTIKYGTDTLLTLPANTIVPANDLYETEAPIIDGVSYSNWSLKLLDDKDEQKDENSWHIETTRTCRIHQR